MNSGSLVSNVSKKLNYLIIGEKPTKRKVENAKGSPEQQIWFDKHMTFFVDDITICKS